MKVTQQIFLPKISHFCDCTGWLLSFLVPRLDRRKGLYNPGKVSLSPVSFPEHLAQVRCLGEAQNEISSENEVSKKQCMWYQTV